METGSVGSHSKRFKRNRKRSDSDVMLPDDAVLNNSFGGNGSGRDGRDMTSDLNRGNGDMEIADDGNGSMSNNNTFVCCPTFRFLMRTSLGFVLLMIQIVIVLGIMIFSPMLILMCGAFVMIATSALSTRRLSSNDENQNENQNENQDRNQDGYPNDPDDNNMNNEKANNTYRNHAMSFHDDKNPSNNHFSNQSPDLNVLYSIIPQCLKNTGPFRLYNEIRNQFFSDRVSYELTCSQLYLSVLTTRGKCVKFFLNVLNR